MILNPLLKFIKANYRRECGKQDVISILRILMIDHHVVVSRGTKKDSKRGGRIQPPAPVGAPKNSELLGLIIGFNRPGRDTF